MNENITAPGNNSDAAMLGEVILLSRKVENKLHNICGETEVAGIHALTELIASKLPDETKRQLHYIATVRNHAAHEDNFNIDQPEFVRYNQVVNSVLATLNALYPDNGKTDVENTSLNSSAPEMDIAVERELFDQISRKLAILGYFPAVGMIYLLYMFLQTLFMQGYLLLLLILHICSIILGVRGWEADNDRGLLYLGIGAFVFVYIVTAVFAVRAPLKNLPSSLAYIPVINVIYLPLKWLCGLAWGRFLASLAGLGAFAGGIVGFCCLQNNTYGFAGIAVSWLISLTAACIWGKKSEEE